MSYEHYGSNGRKFFLATVLIGDTIMLSPDNSLRMPPEKPQSSNILGFVKERYDSVWGKTDGSIVYIIYENGRAYPSYLITYNK
jgi:hypothetical protein